jgi:DNA modification methylase
VLSEWFLTRYSKENDICVDLFGGSGSTLIACEKTNRKCFMMELDPHYCGVILDRWQKFTGKKAHREDGVAWDEIRQ